MTMINAVMDDPRTTREQNDDRSTSGGGLGQGRETAAGKPEDQLSDKGRPGKGMGGTSDTGENTDPQNAEEHQR